MKRLASAALGAAFLLAACQSVSAFFPLFAAPADHNDRSGMASIVASACAAQGVSGALGVAVARVESGLNPRARGRAGEIGLMQIKFTTARGLGFTGSPAQLFDPATNAQWGCRHLAEAQHRAGGDPCATATLHNTGIYARPHCSSYGQRVLRLMR